MNVTKKIKIAITSKSNEKLHSEGLTQNTLTLIRMLAGAGYDITPVSQSKYHYGKKIGARKIEKLDLNSIKNFDIVLGVANSLDKKTTESLHSSGGKSIVIEYGNNLLINAARTVYDRGSESFNISYEDETWISPHFEHSISGISAMRKHEVKICPYIWSPTETINDEKLFFNENWKIDSIGVLESNLYFVKMCHIPVLICEEYYNNYSKDIDCYIFGSRILEGGGFNKFANMMNIVKENKMSFEERMKFNHTIKRGYTKCVVSHQIYNELNYLQLECMFLGIPIIHNSRAFKDHGYYYDEMNVKMGSEQLKMAIDNHKSVYKRERERDMERLFEYSPNNKKNISGYVELLESFIQRNF
tara:strand:- start:799 stop:1875 length:1077 start_codon:yes stop_codon:yes gene_type:complete